MATLAEIQEEFSLPGVLAFDEPHPGFIRARITAPSCAAELYLYGAHLTAWQPTGAEPVLYLSPDSLFTAGKAIRGGVPVIFPWFGERTVDLTGNRTGGGQHGFARSEPWQLAFAALAGDDLHLTLTLAPNEFSREAGFDAFRVALQFVFGRELTMRLMVANEAGAPLVFEEALHTYFHVGDVRQIKLHGLADTYFIDKTDNFARKLQTSDPLTLTATTDRPYLDTPSAVTIEDPVLKRRILVAKRGSDTTVVWNPWQELAAKLADLPNDAWPNFVCVESANVSENRVMVAPNEAHVLETRITLEPLA